MGTAVPRANKLGAQEATPRAGAAAQAPLMVGKAGAERLLTERGGAGAAPPQE
jgi:hypothetical protein